MSIKEYTDKKLYNRLKSTRGFTIVELLVVIVVIAILASITLVSYNSIRDRAYNTKTVSAVRSYVNVLNTNLTLNGPISVDDSGGMYYCLGSLSSYPETSHLDEGQCVSGGGVTGTVSNKINTALKEYGEIAVSAQEAKANAGDIYIRGIVGVGNSTISYVLKGDTQACPLGSEVGAGYYSGYTWCQYLFSEDVVKL